jgi:hypothetical protein
MLLSPFVNPHYYAICAAILMLVVIPIAIAVRFWMGE